MNRPKFKHYSNSTEYLQHIATEPYVSDLEKYCDQLEKALDSSCTKLEGLCTVIDILTDKDTAHDKEYWKKKVMEDVD